MIRVIIDHTQRFRILNAFWKFNSDLWFISVMWNYSEIKKKTMKSVKARVISCLRVTLLLRNYLNSILIFYFIFSQVLIINYYQFTCWLFLFQCGLVIFMRVESGLSIVAHELWFQSWIMKLRASCYLALTGTARLYSHTS